MYKNIKVNKENKSVLQEVIGQSLSENDVLISTLEDGKVIVQKLVTEEKSNLSPFMIVETMEEISDTLVDLVDR